MIEHLRKMVVDFNDIILPKRSGVGLMPFPDGGAPELLPAEARSLSRNLPDRKRGRATARHLVRGWNGSPQSVRSRARQRVSDRRSHPESCAEQIHPETAAFPDCRDDRHQSRECYPNWRRARIRPAGALPPDAKNQTSAPAQSPAERNF